MNALENVRGVLSNCHVDLSNLEPVFRVACRPHTRQNDGLYDSLQGRDQHRHRMPNWDTLRCFTIRWRATASIISRFVSF